MVSCSSIIVRCSCFIVFVFILFSFMHISRLPTVGTGERQVINQWAKSLAITSMGKAAYWGGYHRPRAGPGPFVGLRYSWYSSIGGEERVDV